MIDRRRTVTAYAFTVALFLACAGVMALLAHSRPAKLAQHRAPPSRENLDAPREVQGVPCSGYVELAPDGRLVSCILSREHAFGTIVLPANTQLSLRSDGTLEDVHLGRDTALDGHHCLGHGPGEWMAGFHPNGRLAYCFLAGDETIDGVPCRRGSFRGEIGGGVIVKFHDNGRLAACRLATDVTIAGQTYEKGKRIALDPQGNVVPAGRRSR